MVSVDGRVSVRNLTDHIVHDLREMHYFFEIGNEQRMVGATDMNEHSSRSHTVFTVRWLDGYPTRREGFEGGG